MIIPKPNYYSKDYGYFHLDGDIYIPAHQGELAKLIGEIHTVNIHSIKGKQELRKISMMYSQRVKEPEGYELVIKKSEIIIKAKYSLGRFYGLQSLRQMIMLYGTLLPCCHIKDSPRFKHRGFMLDVSRHFFSVENVLKVMDLMALLKMNKLHLHLTDDQGWRIAIKSYPKLESHGSIRKGTISLSQINKSPIEGCYSEEDIKRLVNYAKKKHIEIIPEIDFPGHIQSAISAYPYLSCKEHDVSVRTLYGISHHILCAGKETTYEFLEKVLDEVVTLFEAKTIHIGGDEVPKRAWKNCTHCQNRMKELGLSNEEELQSYMMNRLYGYLKKKDVNVIGWNDIIHGGDIDENITYQYWVDSRKNKNKLFKEINSHRQVIISDYFHYYFDMPHNISPLKKIYEFNPIPKEVSFIGQHHIKGIEAALWTEYVDEATSMEKMILPRIFAVSETAWTRQNEKSYPLFLNNVRKLLVALGKKGYAHTSLKKAEAIGHSWIGRIYVAITRLVMDYNLVLIKKAFIQWHKYFIHSKP